MASYREILNHLCNGSDLICNVKRSSGTIETNWKVLTRYDDGKKVPDIDDGGCICCATGILTKNVPLLEFAHLNSDKLVDLDNNKIFFGISQDGRFICPDITNDDIDKTKWL